MSENILIPFTRDEWEIIREALEDVPTDINHPRFATEVNIIDRIEKNLGVE